MMRRLCAALTGFLLGISAASAETLEIFARQTGGFGEHAAENLPSFQNYFIGYASVSGGGGKVRTSERRSFFVFDIPTIDGAILSASLVLQLSESGLKYGLMPGDPDILCAPYPSVPVCKEAISDPTETFAVGVTSIPSETVLSPVLDPGEVTMIWDSLASTKVGEYTFTKGFPPPSSPDPGHLEIVTELAAPGLGAIETHEGGSLVLTGWMPTWSFDPRVDEAGVFFEGSEAIFMFSDVHAGVFTPPVLEIVYAPVPEPARGLLLLAGLGALACGAGIRRSHRTGGAAARG